MLAEAVERTIAALEATGRLEEVDTALVEACRMLARQIDNPPECVKCGGASADASMWREFRQYEMQLRLAGAGKGDDALSALLAALQAPLVHPEEP